MLTKCEYLNRVLSSVFITGLIITLFCPVNHVHGQSPHFKIKIEKISIQDTFQLRGLSADFPNPVMSVITVKNQHQHYVHGLANNKKWIGPGEKTDSGDWVDNIWDVIIEMHMDNPSYPGNRNVKQMTPEYRVTEAKSVTGYGVSIGLAMDYSGSMGSGINHAENAARLLVREITTNDKVAIVKITDVASVFQDFTNDTTLLMSAIGKKPSDRSGTALNLGIQTTLELCKNQRGRRVVVVYTDGMNDMAGPTAEEIVTFALDHHITIFTIGLGDEIEESDLQYIAEKTNGFYQRTPNADKITYIYQQIYNYIQGYYVLAHTTTDPFHNGTWRKLQISLKQGTTEGRSWGKYYVPFVPPNVRISKTVSSDSTVIANDDTLYFADAGDTVSYQIRLMNNGTSMAGDIWIVDSLAQYLEPFNILPEPQIVSNDSIGWRIPQLAPGEDTLITYQAKISREMPKTVTQLVNRVHVDCPYDFLPDDNQDEAVLYAVGYPDFIISCTPFKKKASPGYPLRLKGLLSNLGTSHSVVPVDVAFYLEGEGSNPISVQTSPPIAASGSSQVQYIWPDPQPGIYHLTIIADYQDDISELDETNNQDTCTVQVAIDSIWIQVSDISFTDSVLNVQGRFPENILTSVNVLDQNGNPVPDIADADRWLTLSGVNHQGLPMESVWKKLTETHLDNPVIPENPDVLQNIKILERKNTRLNCALVVDFSTAMQPWEEHLPLLADILSDGQNPDWAALITLKNDVEISIPATQDPDEISQALLDVSLNTQKRQVYDGLYQGIELASGQGGRNGVVSVVSGEDAGSERDQRTVIQFAQEVGVPIYFLILNAEQSAAGFHQISEETGGLSVSISNTSDFQYGLDLIERTLRHYYTLTYATPDTVQNQTWRVVDVGVSVHGFSAEGSGVYLSPLGIADLGIQKSAVGSFTINQTDWGIQPGDSLIYQLAVRNLGHHTVYNIQIDDALPVGVFADSISIEPFLANGNQLQWQIDSIGIGQVVHITYQCFVDTMDYKDITPLINHAALQAVQDTIPENNAAQDTVWYYPLSPADLTVWKEGLGDSLAVSGQDSIWYTYPGDTIRYTIQITNQGEKRCRDVTVRDILPDYVTLIDSPETASVQGDTMLWQIDCLDSRGDYKLFYYTCRVDTSMPPWEVLLINEIIVESPFDTLLENNTYKDTVWAGVVLPPNPQIRVLPKTVEPGDSIQVQVMTPVFIHAWDLYVVYGDGSVGDTYADSFIEFTDLTPNEWTTITPPFDDTWMRTENNAEERVQIVLETVDYWNSTRTDTASFTIQSSNKFLLDRNVFRSDRDDFIRLTYKLSTNRNVRIIIYDLAGGFVKEVVRGPQLAGWNSCTWNGINDQDCRMGSGVYIAVISSGSYQKMLKFMVVR